MISAKQKVNIIVPVYDDWNSLRQNIAALKKYYTSSDVFEIYYVNDCGPRADLLEGRIKKAVAGIDNFHYSRNKKNLGFVKNCNNAVFKIAKNKNADILLLNSDAIITQGFAEEMIDVLHSQEDICAVSPRGNNATVWSVPTDGSLAHRPNKSYSQWLKLKEIIPSKYISPTIHGFCVLIRRNVIDDIGLFDEAYGRGYGEENDFSMRARKAGWKCAIANHAFVFHHGSRSFGVKNMSDLSSKNSKILLKRYPDYSKLVAKYVNEHQEPKIIRNYGAPYRLFRIMVSGVEYGYVNGYKSVLRKIISIAHRRVVNKEKTNTEPKIQIWSHEISKTGAPLVLFDIIRQWQKDKDLPKDIALNYPHGARADSSLLESLRAEGVNFSPVHMLEVHFNVGDVVVLNSTSQPDQLYHKIITGLQNNTIKHLYFYIHEDDERTTGATYKYQQKLRDLIVNDKVTVYAPSKGSVVNWKKHLGVNKNIFSMPGKIPVSSGMLKPRPESDFDKINFVIAGSREPRKGILNVIHALQAVDKFFLKNSPTQYRDFTLTVVGDNHNSDFYNGFLEKEASYFGDKIKLIGNTPHKEIYAILQNTNFTITYSLADSLSMVTFEGMAFGHPIIRSEASGQEEQLSIGKNGWLAHTTNWGELVDSIEEVLNKERTTNKDLARMSAESIKLARKNQSEQYKILDDIKKIF